MTPKEKAEELIDKFKPYSHYYIHDLVSRKHNEAEQLENAKECALIAIDELIMQNGELYLNGLNSTYYREKNNFLFNVKQEIENL